MTSVVPSFILFLVIISVLQNSNWTSMLNLFTCFFFSRCQFHVRTRCFKCPFYKNCTLGLYITIQRFVFLLGGGGEGLLAICCICRSRFAIWPFRSFSALCIPSTDSWSVLLRAKALCLSLCNSSMFAFIIFSICCLCACMPDRNCSSRRLFSSSCLAFNSSSWNKNGSKWCHSPFLNRNPAIWATTCIWN